MTLCVVVVEVVQYRNFLVLNKSGAMQSSARNSFFLALVTRLVNMKKY